MTPRPLVRRLTALTSAGLAVLALTGPATLSSASASPASSTAFPATAAGLPGAAALAQGRPGLSRLLALGTSATTLQKAIVTFDAVPTAAQATALRALGLTVRPMQSLPMATVAGPVAALVQVVAQGIGRDVYPDEVLAYSDTASSDVMSSSPAAAKALRAKGLTGKGVTVGIVDSGCDATHPDLADHVVHNVILYSPEYANAGTTPVLPVPIGDTPYSNTDIGSGHGTHVAGIVAADGTNGAEFLGVAPDAELACFAIGLVIATTAVVTAYDYALSQPDMLGIDVFNNSWGNSFRQYDPADPVNVATKAVTDEGAVVVFAAGNSGSGNAEASVSPFNQAPWVMSVAAGALDRTRGDFSSNGLEYDNGKAVPIGSDGHTAFTGDRFGLTQPDLMAPGVDISSTCDSTGTVIGPCPDGGNATASGTSMASPHVAGAAAVLLQANPKLTPAQVQQAFKATATPVLLDGKAVNSFQVGYGHINLDKAVALVQGRTGTALEKALSKAMKKADARIARQDAYSVVRADQWQEDAPPVAVGGSYTATHELTVGKGVSALKVALVYPTPGTAANLAQMTATILDAAGNEVGVTTTDILYAHGTASALVKGIKPGAYTIEVVGDYAASDPDTIDSDSVNGRVVFLSATQLRER